MFFVDIYLTWYKTEEKQGLEDSVAPNFKKAGVGVACLFKFLFLPVRSKTPTTVTGGKYVTRLARKHDKIGLND